MFDSGGTDAQPPAGEKIITTGIAGTEMPLSRLSAGGSIMANPVSFLVDGRQHIAIAAASAVFVFSL